MTMRSEPNPETRSTEVPTIERNETVVTHGASQDTTERRSAGSLGFGSPATVAKTSSTVVRDEVAGSRNRVAQIKQIIWFVAGVFEVLLAVRLALKLTAANQASDFTQLMFGLTEPLVALFLGIFPNASANSFEFEPASVVAMVVYFLVALGLTQLVRILYGETSPAA